MRMSARMKSGRSSSALFRLHAVGGGGTAFESLRTPVHHGLKPGQDLARLVVNQQNSIHPRPLLFRSSLASGIRSDTVVPRLRSLATCMLKSSPMDR